MRAFASVPMHHVGFLLTYDFAYSLHFHVRAHILCVRALCTATSGADKVKVSRSPRVSVRWKKYMCCLSFIMCEVWGMICKSLYHTNSKSHLNPSGFANTHYTMHNTFRLFSLHPFPLFFKFVSHDQPLFLHVSIAYAGVVLWSINLGNSLCITYWKFIIIICLLHASLWISFVE